MSDDPKDYGLPISGKFEDVSSIFNTDLWVRANDVGILSNIQYPPLDPKYLVDGTLGSVFPLRPLFPTQDE